MPQGLSLRAFARADGCDDKLVRRKVASGHLKTFSDGSIDPALVGTAWRRSNGVAQPSAPTADADNDVRADNETSEQTAARLVYEDGRVFSSEAEAKRHKESFLAHQRQLDYDRDVGSVVAVDDVVAAVAAEYALVRNRLLNIATRVSPRAAMLRTPEEVRSLIEIEVALALNELSLDASGGAEPEADRRTIQGRFAKPH